MEGIRFISSFEPSLLGDEPQIGSKQLFGGNKMTDFMSNEVWVKELQRKWRDAVSDPRVLMYPE